MRGPADQRDRHVAAQQHLSVDELIDRARIADLIGRYCYGMDARNWELYRSCWTEDLTSGFLAMSDAPPGTTIKLDDFVDMLRAIFEDIPYTQHLKIPVAFRFDADRNRASVLAVMQGKHWAPSRSGATLQTMIGYYDDDYVRTAEGWKMTKLREIGYWNEGNAESLARGQRRALTLLKERYPTIDWEKGIRTTMAGTESSRTTVH